ncbi:RNA-binding domain-containing protein [Zopfia rhizophila CBS 207.26]|uniref:RNA-binding domain-containing protein n=1 Tax=Zopfia rhizophila CBS 207.26 TaxID=1314779 RepID=A0A6A6ECY7_9PEZI|nr:RNA-binding domain-containing protein [Zopfia rhizophila CBS 207.26]
MGPRRKRQRLSEDGAEAVTATTDLEKTPDTTEAIPDDEEVSKQNLQQRRSLFVRSLAPPVSTDDLTEHFSQSYPIKHAIAVLNPTTKQCKGYGFVTFADAEDAQRAKEVFNGSELAGRKIRVEIAEPRHRDVSSEIPGHKKSIPSAAAVEAKAAREQQRREQQQPPKLIIRNLPWSIKEPDQLAVLFRSYGKIKHATLPKNKTGQLAGFGFIVLRGRKNAERALGGVNGKEVDGRTLAVDWAVEKETWQNLQSAAQDKDIEATNEEGESESSDESVAEASESEDDDESVNESEIEDSNADYEDVSQSEDGGVEVTVEGPKQRSDSNTLFIRNLPFTATDDSLKEHFIQFGLLRYARVVLDHETERSKGTGFVCFAKEEDAINCLKGLPRTKLEKNTSDGKDGSTITVTRSILENEDADPTGRYTMDGRILQISRAVDRKEAARLTAEGAESRFNRDKDKRRLYLLSEGTIPKDSSLYQKLSPSEITLREASAKQRRQLIQNNPSLHLSLTRLSIRNIPRSITSKDLKALARQAIVGFASDVKEGKRQKLSKEELARGGDAMIAAEKQRKRKGKGIVKQAKVVFETPEGSKVAEEAGAGRSRGYGFIEYYTHRSALMGLRWLNGHGVDYRVKGPLPKGKKAAKEALEDRKKRLIVEFAIENANVVSRRTGREQKARDPTVKEKEVLNGNNVPGAASSGELKGRGKKRKWDSSDAVSSASSSLQKKKSTKAQGSGAGPGADAAAKEVKDDDKLAKRSRIIQKKRVARRAKKAGRAV